MSKGFPKKQHLRSKSEFQSVYSARQRLSGRYYVFYYRGNETGVPRLAVVTSRRNVPKAVTRNLLKRLSREVFRHRQENLSPVDVIVVAKPQATTGSRQELRQCLDELFSQLITRSKPLLSA